MTLQDLIKKYPNIKRCVETYENIEYLNVQKAKQLMINEQFLKDIETFTGDVLIDSNNNTLENNEQIITN